MAREHARIWLDINDDEDFEKLSFDAQAFYTRIVLTEPTLNYCGVADWRPQRLTSRAPDLTLPRILRAASELEAANYLLFDLDTEEVLARSYIRRDELLRNPKMAATVIKAYPAVASRVLRAAVITEVQRVHREHPDYSSWGHKDTADGLARMLSKPPLTPGSYAVQITYPNPVRNGDAIPATNGYPHSVPITYPDPVENTDLGTGPDSQSFSVGNPSTSTLHPSPAPLEGYVSTEGHQGDDPDQIPPPRYCPEHMPDGDSGGKACRACGDAGSALRAWTTAALTAEREAERREQWEVHEAAAMAIVNCGMCDDDGYRSGTVCDHVDRTGVAEAGMAKVRAALAKGSES